jgi:hypothetical protein
MLEFYQKLNNEKDSSRWIEWQNHRREISSFISETISFVTERENTIVFGAGNCDDLDLKFLTDQFRSVWLADIDLPSMTDALEKIDSSIKNQCQLIVTDFTKLDQIDFYVHFKQLLDAKTNAKQVVDYLYLTAEQITDIEILPHLKNKFQVVISSAVYTQIFYMQALTMLAGHVENYNKEETTLIIQALLELRNVVIRNYNDLLVSLVTTSGRIIVWTDVSKIDSDGSFMEAIYTLQTDRDRSQYVLNEVRKNGRLEALSGLDDMQNKFVNEGRLFHHWIWPYSDKNHCIVFGISGKVNRSTFLLCIVSMPFI